MLICVTQTRVSINIQVGGLVVPGFSGPLIAPGEDAGTGGLWLGGLFMRVVVGRVVLA